MNYKNVGAQFIAPSKNPRQNGGRDESRPYRKYQRNDGCDKTGRYV